MTTVETEPQTAALAARGDHARQDEVRQALLTSPLLTSVELDHGSGVILATRHA